MKAFLLYILCLALALILLPAMLVENWWKWDIEAEARVESIEPVPQALEEKFILKIYLANAGESKEMELEEYVAGVVTAEMPASFNLEALKAQAVITRTYTLQKALSLGGEGCRNHPEADLCGRCMLSGLGKRSAGAGEMALCRGRCLPRENSGGGWLNRRARLNIWGKSYPGSLSFHLWGNDRRCGKCLERGRRFLPAGGGVQLLPAFAALQAGNSDGSGIVRGCT